MLCSKRKIGRRISKRVEEGIIPVVKGHILNEEDLKLRRHILNLMCQLETTFTPENSFEELPEALKNYKKCKKMVWLEISENTVENYRKRKSFHQKCCDGF